MSASNQERTIYMFLNVAENNVAAAFTALMSKNDYQPEEFYENYYNAALKFFLDVGQDIELNKNIIEKNFDKFIEFAKSHPKLAVKLIEESCHLFDDLKHKIFERFFQKYSPIDQQEHDTGKMDFFAEPVDTVDTNIIDDRLLKCLLTSENAFVINQCEKYFTPDSWLPAKDANFQNGAKSSIHLEKLLSLIQEADVVYLNFVLRLINSDVSGLSAKTIFGYAKVTPAFTNLLLNQLDENTQKKQTNSQKSQASQESQASQPITWDDINVLELILKNDKYKDSDFYFQVLASYTNNIFSDFKQQDEELEGKKREVAKIWEGLIDANDNMESALKALRQLVSIEQSYETVQYFQQRIGVKFSEFTPGHKAIKLFNQYKPVSAPVSATAPALATMAASASSSSSTFKPAYTPSAASPVEAPEDSRISYSFYLKALAVLSVTLVGATGALVAIAGLVMMQPWVFGVGAAVSVGALASLGMFAYSEMSKGSTAPLYEP